MPDEDNNEGWGIPFMIWGLSTCSETVFGHPEKTLSLLSNTEITKRESHSGQMPKLT
jgi:hypothetical protein